MKISDFVAITAGGMARSNRYTMILEPPEGTLPAGIQLRNLLLYCDNIVLPGLSINTTPIRIFGEERQTPTEFSYESINVSFYVDSEMHIKEFFDNWIKKIQYGRERTFAYYDSYISDVKILIQDVKDNSRYQITLYECYPKTIFPIQLDYGNKDVMKLNVNLQYKYWEHSIISETKSGRQSLKGFWDSAIDGNPIAAIAALAEQELFNFKTIPDSYNGNFFPFQSNMSNILNTFSNDSPLTGDIKNTVLDKGQEWI